METIAPGVYPDLSNDDYHGHKGSISKSGISLMLESPQKYKARYLDGYQQETTQPMIIGSATHTAVFEPDLFDSEYVVAPKFDKRTKAGKAAFAEFQETAGGRIVIDNKDALTINLIRDAVHSHPKAGAIVKSAGAMVESSIFSEHAETGFLVKIRPDFMLPDQGVMADLKTTTNASWQGFSKSIVNFTYHIQAGMYLEVARQQGFEVQDFLLIAVEKTPPYAVGVYYADREMIELGKEEYDRGMELYVECMSTGEFPGYNRDQIVKIALPQWAARQIAER